MFTKATFGITKIPQEKCYKNKKETKGLSQTRNFFHSEGSHQQNEKAIYWMGEDICKRYLQ